MPRTPPRGRRTRTPGSSAGTTRTPCFATFPGTACRSSPRATAEPSADPGGEGPRPRDHAAPPCEGGNPEWERLSAAVDHPGPRPGDVRGEREVGRTEQPSHEPSHEDRL